MSRLEIIRSYYEPKLNRELPDYAKLGWESVEAQKLRFDAFLDNIDAQGKSLLDVGCGLGNLLEYVTGRNLDIRYTGVDILGKMIDCARDKGLNGEFHCLDIFDSNPFGKESFDIIYASGIFNLDLGNNDAFFAQAFCEFLSLSKKIVAFSLLDNRSPGREEGYAYFSPAGIIETIESSPCRPKKVQIIEQYLNNDFTVICEK
jgi:SAM-dependent methyltransferase